MYIQLILSFLILLLGVIGIILSYKKGRKDLIQEIKEDILKIEKDSLKDPDMFLIDLMNCLKKLK